MVNHRVFNSAMIGGHDFLAAERRTKTELRLPVGPKIELTGGLDFNDDRLLWDRLDKVHAKHPGMVLLLLRIAEGCQTHRRKQGRPSQGAADRL